MENFSSIFMEEIIRLLYFPNIFTFDLLFHRYHFTHFNFTFLPYFPYHFTFQTFLPHFPYLFTINLLFSIISYSTYLFSIFSKSCNLFSSIFSLSFYCSTYFSSILSILKTYFSCEISDIGLSPYILRTIQLGFLPYFPYHGRFSSIVPIVKKFGK